MSQELLLFCQWPQILRDPSFVELSSLSLVRQEESMHHSPKLDKKKQVLIISQQVKWLALLGKDTE